MANKTNVTIDARHYEKLLGLIKENEQLEKKIAGAEYIIESLEKHKRSRDETIERLRVEGCA
jgi:hypothetical protein